MLYLAQANKISQVHKNFITKKIIGYFPCQESCVWKNSHLYFDADQGLNGPLSSILQAARQSAHWHCIKRNSPPVKNSEKIHTCVSFEAEQLLNGQLSSSSSGARDPARHSSQKRCFKAFFGKRFWKNSHKRILDAGNGLNCPLSSILHCAGDTARQSGNECCK